MYSLRTDQYGPKHVQFNFFNNITVNKMLVETVQTAEVLVLQHFLPLQRRIGLPSAITPIQSCLESRILLPDLVLHLPSTANEVYTNKCFNSVQFVHVNTFL